MKRRISVLLAILMLLTLVFVGCKDKVTEINILNEWSGNADEEIYTINSSKTSLELEYSKNGMEWAYAQRLLNTLPKKQLAALEKINTIVFTGSQTKTAGSLDAIVKIEYDDATSTEAKFAFTETEATYEWDVSELDLTKAVRILLFADAGGKAGVGKITITSFKFTSAAVNEANQIGKPAPAPTYEVNNYTSGDTFALNAGWYDAGDGVYTITKDGTAFNLAYAKGNSSWASAKAYVKGDLSAMKKLILTVQGTANNVLLVKPFDKGEYELRITLTGEEQVVEVPLTATVEAPVDWTAEQAIFIFAMPDTTDVTGSFTIKSAVLSNEEPTPPVNKTVEFTGSDTLNLIVDGKLQDVDGGKYTYTFADGGVTLNYVANVGWSATLIEADAKTATFNALRFTVQGTAGHAALFKFEPTNASAIEYKFENTTTLTGEEQTFVIPVPAGFTGQFKLRIFTNFPDNGAAGALIIKKAEALYLNAPTTAGEDFSANAGFHNSNPDGRFTFTYETGKTIVAYNTANWNNFITHVDLGEGGYKTVKFSVKGIAGHTAIFNVDGKEQKFEHEGVFTGEVQEFELDVTGKTGIIFIRIFADWDAWADMATNANASIEINKIEFSTEGDTPEPPAPQPKADAQADIAVAKWQGDIVGENPIQTLTMTDNGLKIAYNKNNNAYSNVNISPENMADYGYVKITFVSVANVVHIFKIEDGGTVKEVRVQGTGFEQTLVLENIGNKKLVIMAEGDTATVAGELLIKSVVLTDYPNVINIAAANWAGDVTTTYTLTDDEGALKINYDKAAGSEWSNTQIPLPQMPSYKYLVVEFKAANNIQHLFKVEGGAAKEYWVTGTGEKQIVYIEVGNNNKLVLMAQGGAVSVTGEIIVYSATLTNDAPPVNVELPASGWMGDVNTIYTITKEGTTLKLAYNKLASGQEWASVFYDVPNMAKYYYAEIVFKGEADAVYMFKVEGGTLKECFVTANGETQSVYIPLGKSGRLVIFAAPNNNVVATGTLEIISMSLLGGEVKEELPETANVNLAVANWAGDLQEPLVYVLTMEGTSLQVNYTKTNHQYSNIRIQPTNMAQYGFLTITFTGSENDAHIFKVQGGTVKEETVTCTGAKQTFTIAIGGCDTFVIMAEAALAEASGSILIESIVLSIEEPQA